MRQDIAQQQVTEGASLQTASHATEYRIISQTSREAAEERLQARHRRLRAAAEEEEHLVRTTLLEEEAVAWAPVPLQAEHGALEVTEGLWRADMAELQGKAWMELSREAIASRVALNDRERVAQAVEGLVTEEAAGRRAVEDAEEEAAAQLSVECCRIVLEENRRVVQRRRDGAAAAAAATPPLDPPTEVPATSAAVLRSPQCGISVQELREARQALQDSASLCLA